MPRTTRTSRSTPNSRSTSLAFGRGSRGTNKATPHAATAPISATQPNDARQPSAWPSAVPPGTPRTLARVRPANISDIAGRADFAAQDRPPPPRRCRRTQHGRRRKHARRHQKSVRGRQRAHQVAEGEQRHQADQRALARQPGGDDRQDRRADDDARGVARDDQAGGRNRHVEIARHIGQQAHDDEFGRADAERPDGEGGEGQGETQGGSDRAEGGTADESEPPRRF